MSQPIHFADRLSLTDASELISRFGDFAASEAAVRARRSRDVGTVVQFCHWRQIERIIEFLRDESVTGSVH